MFFMLVHIQNGSPDKESDKGFSTSTGSATPHMTQNIELSYSLASYSALAARSSFRH